jgi:hypothetical protein
MKVDSSKPGLAEMVLIPNIKIQKTGAWAGFYAEISARF